METIKKFLDDAVKHYGEILECGSPPIVHSTTENVLVKGKKNNRRNTIRNRRLKNVTDG